MLHAILYFLGGPRTFHIGLTHMKPALHYRSDLAVRRSEHLNAALWVFAWNNNDEATQGAQALMVRAEPSFYPEAPFLCSV